MRGETVPVGAERVAKNGYIYVKTPDGKQRLKHHVIMEGILGRSINTEVERVVFLDKNNKNLDPSNLEVRNKKIQSIGVRRAQLEAKIADLQGQLEDLDAEEEADGR